MSCSVSGVCWLLLVVVRLFVVRCLLAVCCYSMFAVAPCAMTAVRRSIVVCWLIGVSSLRCLLLQVVILGVVCCLLLYVDRCATFVV